MQRAFISYNPAEWWNGHLASTLVRHMTVELCPMESYNQVGHSVDADLGESLRGHAQGFYLGSVDQLFRGLRCLHMPTGIWTDYLPGVNDNFLPCMRLFDIVFCAQKGAVDALRDEGINTEWLPYAFDTTLVNDPGAEKHYEVAFVGSLNLPPSQGNRRAILAELERHFHLNDYRTPVFGDEMVRTYNRARIIVNIPAPYSFNMRTFEALPTGALLMTRAVGNGQDELFKDGTHLVTYRDTADLIDKIRYYLRRDTEREEIAAAGRREVLARHTYEHRAAQVLDAMARMPRRRTNDRNNEVAAYAAFYEFRRRPDLLARLACEPGVSGGLRVRLMARAGAQLARGVALRIRSGAAVAA